MENEHSLHIEAKISEIADTVLFPGDPLRAKWIAENYLTDVVQYNSVRGMLGFTGKTKNGTLISVQGSGMGQPSVNIYANELIRTYGVKNIIRIGTAGGISKKVGTGSIVFGMAASTDSALNKRRFDGMNFAPAADFELLYRAYSIAQEQKKQVFVGGIASLDKFYEDMLDNHTNKIFGEYGVLAIEMESSELYTLASRFGVKSLTLLTVSDDLIRKEYLSQSARQIGLTEVMEIAIPLVESL